MTVLLVLKIFITACDSNSIQEVSAMCLLPDFIREPARAALLHQFTANKKHGQQGGRLITYSQVFKYSLETNATDDVSAEAETDISSFKKPAGMSTVCYSDAL